MNVYDATRRVRCDPCETDGLTLATQDTITALKQVEHADDTLPALECYTTEHNRDNPGHNARVDPPTGLR